MQRLLALQRAAVAGAEAEAVPEVDLGAVAVAEAVEGVVAFVAAVVAAVAFVAAVAEVREAPRAVAPVDVAEDEVFIRNILIAQFFRPMSDGVVHFISRGVAV